MATDGHTQILVMNQNDPRGPMDMANVLQTKPQDWEYVSEGGATIVFSYTGPSHAQFNGTVLRLRKSPISVSDAAMRIHDTDTDERESDDPMIEYQEKCMEKLMPTEYLPKLQSVDLDRRWLEKLLELHNHARPQDRREKDQVDLNRKKGVLATDLVGGDWLTVEIKPKWGFLPSPIHLSKETGGVKTRTCRFCMHSYMRVQKGEQVATDYCPLDLFSNDETRVKNAIYSLWKGWVASDATANNLKIFARGKFLTPPFETKFMLEENIDGIDIATIRDLFVDALSRPLLHTPVLRILSSLQRNLDPLDIEGLSKLWEMVHPPNPTPSGGGSHFAGITEPDISDWVKFLDLYSSGDKSTLDHAHPSPENLRQYLMSYLLSATFKDCSIIIKLAFLDSSKPQQLSENSVTVIDLDPKKMAKLYSWEKLDQEIVSGYLHSAHKGRVCVDQWQE